jgi:Tol biopolymer transport system component
MAQPFDLARLELTGGAAPIADPVLEAQLFSKGLFSASENGLLTYVEGGHGADRQLVWFDRSGKQVGAVPGEDAYSSPRISPDGKRLLFYLDSGGYDVWSYDIDRGVKTPQTFGSASAQSNIFPSWSPDGSRIVYTSYDDGKYVLTQKASDGSSSAEALLEGAERYRFPSDWSPDGKFLAYHEGTQGGWAIWILPLEGKRAPHPLHRTEFSERDAAFSPDGRWLAYCSNESGENRVYVEPFPGPGGKWQVSPGGGTSPRWRRDGREIFYFSSDSHLMAAEVRPGPAIVEVGAVRSLFETRSYGVFGRFDVTADGQRFIVPYEAGQPATAIALVENWPSDIR